MTARLARAAAAVAAFGALLVACEDQCVRGHWQAVVVGKVITQQWFCDEYAEVAP